MKIKKTRFKGLLIIKQKDNLDTRGSLRETFKRSDLEDLNNLTISLKQPRNH